MQHKIVLVDDHPVFREGLNHLLAKEKDLRVVGEAGDGQMAIEMVLQKKPDLVVMDINMPNLDGIEATRRLLSEAPETRVVALSVHSGKQFIRDMIEAGALGYILKESIPEEMVEGIRTVLTGNVYLSKTISNALVLDYKDLVSDAQPGSDAPVFSVLYTKLYPPTITADIVPRVHLVELLEKGAQYPMSLIVGPAGYGKSILASQWLEVTELPSGWVSLDEGDNDLSVFLSYVVEAIQTIFPGHELQTKPLLGLSNLPSSKVIARYLLNDLETLPERFILVVDDYQFIHKAAIHDLLMELLVHPSPRIHLVLISRRDPPLPLTSLRGRGMLTEISVQKLRFSALETRSYLGRFLQIAISDQTAQVLEEKVEGWVTGLHLAALSIRNEADQERVTAGLLETSQYVSDYLVEEALSQVPVEFEVYLLATAILDRFRGSLCDAIVPKGAEGHHHVEAGVNGRIFIEWLNKMHLFVIPLDADNRWFRYHHMFQDLLQGQLKNRHNAEAIAALHSRAGLWFGENGFIEEALQHALAAGDIKFAVMQIERYRQTVMNQEQWSRMGRLLKMFPDKVVQTHPELLMMRAWIAYDVNRMEEMEEILGLAESMINAITHENIRARSLRGELNTLLGYKSNVEADSKNAMIYLQKAIEMLPSEYDLARGQVAVSYCIARQMSGNQLVIQEVEQTLTAEDVAHKSAFHSRKLAGYCFANWMNGDLAGLLKNADQLFHYSKKWSLPETMNCAQYFSGIACYYRNDISMAEQHLIHVVENIYRANGIVGIQSCFALAQVYQSQGFTQKARETVEMAATLAKERQSPFDIVLTQAFMVELDLLQGRMNQVQRWADQFNPDLFRALTWFYFPPLTLAKVWLAQGTSESLQQAAELLDRLDDFVVSIHNTRFRIEILALQGLFNDYQGNQAAALKKLAGSIVLAEPGGFIRNYVNMGLPMADLLKRLGKQNIAGDHVEKVLGAFRDDERTAAPETAGDPIPSSNGASRSLSLSQPLIEPLTNRELDVLELLAGRLQNKEIADKLFISTGTVKGHLKNIYQKLIVKSRLEAVAEAKRLDII